MQQRTRIAHALAATLLATCLVGSAIARPSTVFSATLNRTAFAGSAGQGPFLQTSGGRFVYNGVPITLYGGTMYQSRGGNAPAYNWNNPAFTQRIDWDLNLAQQAGFNVVRPTD